MFKKPFLFGFYCIYVGVIFIRVFLIFLKKKSTMLSSQVSKSFRDKMELIIFPKDKTTASLPHFNRFPLMPFFSLVRPLLWTGITDAIKKILNILLKWRWNHFIWSRKYNIFDWDKLPSLESIETSVRSRFWNNNQP